MVFSTLPVGLGVNDFENNLVICTLKMSLCLEPVLPLQRN